MSYVLDALKKAERERRRQSELGLDNLEQEDWINPPEPSTGSRSGSRLWIAAAGLSLAVGVLVAGLNINFFKDDIPSAEPSFDGTATVFPVEANRSVEPEIKEQEIVDNLPAPSAQNLSLNDFVAELRFEGSLYLEGNPEASRVFIDGQTYFAGDSLTADVYISDISPNSVTLSKGYEQVVQSLR